MIAGIPAETAPGERRVALTPDAVKALVKDGIQVAVQSGAGASAGFDDAAYWGPRDNPDCEANVERLIDAARARGDAIVFIRHDSEEPGSPLRPGQPGNAFKPCVTGEPDLLVVKDVNASFLGRPALAPAGLSEERTR